MIMGRKFRIGGIYIFKQIIISLGSVFILFSLVGCQSTQENTGAEMTIYSFRGEAEGLQVTNGIIAISPEQQILYGGILQHNREDLRDISTYSVKYFILNEEKKETLSSFHYTTEGVVIAIPKEIMLGQSSAKEGIFSAEVQSKIADNLYFEFDIIFSNGEKNEYQIKLDTVEITQD